MSDVEQRKQRSQNNTENEHNSDKTKKNFTGSYTEVNPKSLSTGCVLVNNGRKFKLQCARSARG